MCCQPPDGAYQAGRAGYNACPLRIVPRKWTGELRQDAEHRVFAKKQNKKMNKAFNASTAIVVLRKAINSIAQQQFDTAEALLDRYENKLGRQRHISCLARAVIATARGDDEMAQTLTQRAGVLLAAHNRLNGLEREALIYFIRQLDAVATGQSLINLEIIHKLVGDEPGKAMGADTAGSRSA